MCVQYKKTKIFLVKSHSPFCAVRRLEKPLVKHSFLKMQKYFDVYRLHRITDREASGEDPWESTDDVMGYQLLQDILKVFGCWVGMIHLACSCNKGGS